MKHKTMKATYAALFAAALTGMTAYAGELPTADRAGNEIIVPEKITTVVSMAPSVSQILEDLGLTDLLAAVDTQTAYYMEETADLPQFDMMTPDCESLLALDPDIIFVPGMSYIHSNNPYSELIESGICVVQIPSSESIAAIQEDVLFVSACFGMTEEGEALVQTMNDTIDEITAIGETITEKKRVAFEIGCLPKIYSFGTGVFLNEMLELLGAENVYAEYDSWISLTEESALIANPDVILTSVDYIEDPVGEILSREGWENIEAIKNKAVFYIDTETSGLPNHRIISAFKEMALAVYPEEYAEILE